MFENVYLLRLLLAYGGFPDSSVGKESTCNAGDLGSIPGAGRSPGGRHGNALQYSCLEIPWTEEPGRLQSAELQRVGHNWAHTPIILFWLLSQIWTCLWPFPWWLQKKAEAAWFGNQESWLWTHISWVQIQATLSISFIALGKTHHHLESKNMEIISIHSYFW